MYVFIRTELTPGYRAGGNASVPRVMVGIEGTSSENGLVNYREDVAGATPKLHKSQNKTTAKKNTPGLKYS